MLFTLSLYYYFVLFRDVSVRRQQVILSFSVFRKLVLGVYVATGSELSQITEMKFLPKKIPTKNR